MSSTASSAKRARGLEEINSDGDVDDGDDDGDDDDFVDVAMMLVFLHDNKKLVQDWRNAHNLPMI